MEREGAEWVVREGVGAGGRNDPSIPSIVLYAHMNKKKKRMSVSLLLFSNFHGFGTYFCGLPVHSTIPDT
jgi:hypothetical protein